MDRTVRNKKQISDLKKKKIEKPYQKAKGRNKKMKIIK